MKQCVFLSMLLWGIAGCKSGGKKSVANDKMAATDIRVQEKEFNGTRIMLTYMPPCMQHNAAEEGDTSEIVFRLNVFSEQLKGAKNAAAERALSYGIDSLFTLVSGQDSLPALLAQRIANGNLRGVEYLLVFDRERVRNSGQAVLVFKDWLFTNVRMEFPVNILKIDSISCGL